IVRYRIAYAYDTNGNVTEYIDYEWDSVTSNWIVRYRIAYAYDTNGNVTEYIDYEWDSVTSNWIAWYRIAYTYDTNGNVTEYIDYEWDSGIHDWVYYSKRVSYWSELTTSISENSIDLNYIVYPNPTNDLLTIETDRFDQYSINITSLNGQFIYHTTLEGPTQQIDLSPFQKGIYFITIRSKDFVTTEKIIKL
ncbi:MAG: T9SS type A sorting domain-containing protein, partial [Bacteroidota bacterium]